MELTKFSPEITEKFNAQYWNDLFRAKNFDFSHFENETFYYEDSEFFLWISQEKFAEINKIVSDGNKIFLQAYQYYFQDLAKNLCDFIWFLPYFSEEFPLENFFIGRYDILIDTNDTLQFLETNANTPGMIGDINFPAAELTPAGYENQAEILIAYIKNFWEAKKSELNLKKIGIITAYSSADEDYYTCVNYAEILREIFGEENILVGDIYEMNIIENELVTLKWEPIDAILSYFPLEFFLTDLDFSEQIFALMDAKKIFYVNPIESMILQDKLIFAVIWENIEKFSKEEQDFIHKHIPFTSREFQENENEFIAKWRFGRYGREIFTHDFYTNIHDDSRYIFQKKVTSKLHNGGKDFLVLGAYTNYQKPLGWVLRRQPIDTTNDDYCMVTFVYVESDQKKSKILQ